MININIADLVTIIRIICAALMLIPKPLSAEFFILYALCGLSDILDGFIARKTKTTSKPGSILDSIGDIVFCLSSFIAIYPHLQLNVYVTPLIAIIFMLRVVNIVTGYIKEKKLILLHTALNKVTGLLLFLFPLTLSYTPHTLSATLIAIVALYASINEGYLIWKGRIR